MEIPRALSARLRRRADSRLGRLLVLTGARQTGKTTLARAVFPDFEYISLEDPVLRPEWSQLSAADWIQRHPRAVLDEVQKVPRVIETIKAAHDASPRVRYVLLGSSQILLLDRVKESLAGRAAIEELWPLTLPELGTASSAPVLESRLMAWLRSAGRDSEGLAASSAGSASFARDRVLLDRYLRIGGMPAIHDPALSDEERSDWLRDYQRTYLERDLADLAALRDLEPFVLAQRAIALRSGRLVNWNDLARAGQIAPATARRFLRYLELSYQVIQLRPWFRNEEKRLSKAPKVHFLDPGILQAVLNRRGDPGGEAFESALIAEIAKQLRTFAVRAELYHLRTYDGREIDLVIELSQGLVAVEIKQAEHVGETDARHLRGLEKLLDRPLLGKLLLSRDRHVRRFADGTLGVPAAWALGSPAEP